MMRIPQRTHLPTDQPPASAHPSQQPLVTIRYLVVHSTKSSLHLCDVKNQQRPDMKVENTKAQMRRGVLEYCILSVLAQGELYPSDIISQLKDARLIVVEGTLYPLLSRLKDSGLLTYRWEESRSGPPRKYYKLTTVGERFLAELDQTWDELAQAVKKTTRKNR